MLNSLIEPYRIVPFRLRNLQARVLHFRQLGSTNTFLKEYAQQHADSKDLAGLCAIADQQTAGRGRMERVWHSPAGEGLYFSLLLQPKLVANTSLLTLMAAIATAEMLATFCPRALDIKWPNDIIIANRKIAGILTEASFAGQHLSYVVIGIGINLHQKFFPPELNQRATSLYLEARAMIDRDQVLTALLSRLDHWYGVLLTSPAGIVERWQHLSSFAHNKLIRVIIDGRELLARTCGLEASGSLRAETSDGQLLTLYGGEITAAEKEV